MNATANPSKKNTRTRKSTKGKNAQPQAKPLTLKDLARKQQTDRWIAIGAAVLATGAAAVAGYSALKGDDEISE